MLFVGIIYCVVKNTILFCLSITYIFVSQRSRSETQIEKLGIVNIYPSVSN